MKKTIYAILLLFALQPFVYGQITDSTSKRKYMSLQVLTGTQGLGLSFKYSSNEDMAFRVGVNYGAATVNDKINMDEFSPKNSASGKLKTAHILAEFRPQKSFRVVVGAAYLANAEANIHFEPKDPNMTTPNQDALDFKMDWGGYVAPYFGVGFGRGIPKNRFNVTIDLGAYYLHPPTVKAIGDKSLIDSDKNAAIIENNAKGYRLMPIAQLNFNFKLNKKQ